LKIKGEKNKTSKALTIFTLKALSGLVTEASRQLSAFLSLPSEIRPHKHRFGLISLAEVNQAI